MSVLVLALKLAKTVMVLFGKLPGVPGNDQLYDTLGVVLMPSSTTLGRSQLNMVKGTLAAMPGAKVFCKTEISTRDSQKLVLSLVIIVHVPGTDTTVVEILPVT